MARLEAASAEKARNRGLHLENGIVFMTGGLNSPCLLLGPCQIRRAPGKADAAKLDHDVQPIDSDRLMHQIPDWSPPAAHVGEARAKPLGRHSSRVWDKIIPGMVVSTLFTTAVRPAFVFGNPRTPGVPAE